jgi:hypothetical protein
MRPRSLALPLAALFGLASPLVAQDGMLDTDFGFGDGIAVWGPPAGDSREISGVAPHTERLYVFGRHEVGGGPPVHLDFMGITPAGATTSYACDSATASVFEVPLDTVAESSAEAGIIDSSGNLLLGGWLRFGSTPGVDRPLLARFRTDALGCAIDTTYSDTGWEFFDDETWCDDEDCRIEDLAEILPWPGSVAEPRTVALVHSYVGALSARYFLLALTSEGDIDTGFGGDGWVEIESGTDPLAPGAALAVDPGGRLWVQYARYETTSPVDTDVVVSLYDADGEHQNDFLLPDKDDVDEFAGDLVIAHDGDVVASYRKHANERHVWTLDSVSLTPYDTQCTQCSTHLQLAVQGNARIVAAADDSVADGIVAMRYHGSVAGQTPLNLDGTFDGNGEALFDVDLGSTNTEVVSDVALWGGRPIVAGTAVFDGSRTEGFVARLTGSYVFADGFEGGCPHLWSTSTP